MPAVAPIVGIAGSAIGGLFGNKAAKAQTNAANQAAAIQANALQFQKDSAALNRSDMFPWIATGTNAVNTLSHLMGIAGGTTNAPWDPRYAGATPGAPSPFMVNSPIGGAIPNSTAGANNAASLNPSFSPNMQGSGLTPDENVSSLSRFGLPADGSSGGFMTANGSPAVAQQGANGVASSVAPNTPLSGDGSLAQSWTQAFQAPDNITEQNDPGYRARLKLATDAMQNSAAARGNLLTGGTAKDLGNLAQDYASNEYGNVYNRALGQYQQNYNIFQNNQANLFNRLSALAGGGQVAASNLAGGQTAAAGQVGNSAAQIGQDLNNAGYQRGSGYVNLGNSISSGLGNLGGLISVLRGSGNK